MSRHAFILGGTGQIGRAIAGDLLAAGWNVTVSHRGIRAAPPELAGRGANVVVLDRDKPGDLEHALTAGADVLIDTVAYDQDHGRQLIEIQGSVGAFVVISSVSVYRDALGRTLDEAAQTGFPELPDPIPETQPTVEPGPATYSTRKIRLECHLLDHAVPPVTILRPCAIHGPGSRSPREWWFVKRALDQRPAIPLAYRGISRFHTASVANIAALARVVVAAPGSRILNIADPVAPSVAEIGAVIGRHLDYRGEFVAVDDQGVEPTVGRTPWSVPRPFVVDCRRALDLGYAPATTYADAVTLTCDWLVATAGDGDWKDRFPRLAAYPREHFDYASEDAWFAARSRDGEIS
jgi:nucleoside-diphosphate-sugar epimerase